jgi:hypothetical protein
LLQTRKTLALQAVRRAETRQPNPPAYDGTRSILQPAHWLAEMHALQGRRRPFVCGLGYQRRAKHSARAKHANGQLAVASIAPRCTHSVEFRIMPRHVTPSVFAVCSV